jgi:hypothetical protein
MAIEAANGVQQRVLSDTRIIVTVPVICALIGSVIRYLA